VSHLGIFIALPIAGGLIGLTTKWAALKLLFVPSERVGIGPIGWQGVVQRRAPQMAGGVASSLGGSALDLEALADRIDADHLASIVATHLGPSADRVAEVSAEAVKPGLWETMSAARRAAASDAVTEAVRSTVKVAVEELRPALVSSIDAEAVMVEGLSGPNADRLARVLQAMSDPHIKVILAYGGVLGFLIGLVQAALYSSIERWWLLPLVGAIDGLVNNYLAIQMVFLPRERRRILGLVPMQGLFPSQQESIATSYATILADEVLTPAALARHLGDGVMLTTLPAVMAILDRFSKPLVEMLAADAKVAGTDALRASVAGSLVGEAMLVLPGAAGSLEKALKEQLQVAATIEDHLHSLSAAEFEMMLRPIIKQDEPTLILLGAVLGAAIGALQAVALLASGIA
jgi:uncharacterized membrane protein YheB (UPF0754 family)